MLWPADDWETGGHANRPSPIPGGFIMTTEARISANRRNAQKSTGPKTTVGKAIVAQNAIKHGLLARQNVILGEDPEQFELHRRQVLGELAPTGVIASILAERIVGLAWRLRRAQRLANEAFDYLLARELADSMGGLCDELSPEDEERLKRNPRIDPRFAIGRVVERDCREERVMERLMMHEHRIEGSLYRTMKELQNLKGRPEDAGRPSLPCESEPAGPAQPPCETKPTEAAGSASGQPAGASGATPDGVTTDQSDCAKQSQSLDHPIPAERPLEEAIHSLPCETKPTDPAASDCRGLA